VARSGRLACDLATTGNTPADVWCAQKGQGECVRTGPPTTWKCAGGSVNPALSGWNFIDPGNLFATRDNFRQQVADLAQLRRVLVSTTASPVAPCLNDLLTAQGAGRLDGTTLHFVGHSLGGMLGTLYAAASPDVQHVVLNVPGGGLTDVLLTSPGLAPIRTAMNAGLAAQGIKEGTPGYDQFTSIARWVLDPADALNAAHQVANGARRPTTRRGLVQYVTGDQVIPNPTTQALLASANREGVAQPLWWVEFDGSTLAPEKRHSFLLNGGALTPQVQLQLVQFLATGEKPSGAKP
jgi:pimeloyl-ACP methyl ester carboxylesterase